MKMLRLLITRRRIVREQQAASLLLLRTLFILSVITATIAEFRELQTNSEDGETPLLETVLSASAALTDKQLDINGQKGLNGASDEVDTEVQGVAGTLEGSQSDHGTTNHLFTRGGKSLKFGAKFSRRPDGQEGVAPKAGWTEPDATGSRHKRQASEACQPSWTRQGRSCYKVTSVLSWSDARQACLSMNGVLTDIASLEEENNILDFLNSQGVSRAWIGLNDRQTENQWRWDSGAIASYFHWSTGEPNDVSGNEDCAEILAQSRGGWNDNVCSEAFRGVCKSTACGGTLVGSGTIRSPNFPGSYQNDLNCLWTLQATSPATGLFLQIRRVSTEECCDFIRISNTSGLQLSLSGELQARSVTLRSPATIAFTTDGSVIGTGFEIAFSTMPLACGGTLVGSGTIRSPNFPGSYQNNLNCLWTLQATSPATELFLQIRRVSTEACCDFIRISNTSGLQLSLSGELQPRNVTLGSPATISFTTDGSVIGTGFEIAFSTISFGCGGVIVGLGTIRSPNFPGSYPNNLNCVWTLRAATASDAISLQIRRLSTESCCDFVRVSNTSGLQLSFSGEVESRAFTLGSSATVSFTTDHSVAGTGFEIEFSTIRRSPDCGGIIVGSGTIRSPNFPGTYPNNLNCLWSLQSASALDVLEIRIRQLSTEACCDFVRISNASGLQLSLSGDVWSRDMVLGSAAAVSFTTDGSVSGTGFQIEISSIRGLPDDRFSCGGLLYSPTVITSQVFFQQFPPSVHCRWIIHAANANNSVLLKIGSLPLNEFHDTFVITHGSECEYMFSEELQPVDLLVRSPVEIFIYSNDRRRDANYTGFNITIIDVTGRAPPELSCGGLVYSPAVISSQVLPQHNLYHVSCRWTIRAANASNSVLLQFESLTLREYEETIVINDDSEFQYTFTGEVQPHDLLLRPPVEILFDSLNRRASTNYSRFNIMISDVAGRVPRICRSGHWVMHGELCISVLWYIPHVSWAQGRRLCRSMGGFLVEPDDEEKLQTVGEFLPFHAPQTDEVWIGLKFDDDQNEWLWDTGRRMSYSSWATGQPHQVASNASCAALTMQGISGAWINDDCGAPRAPMCSLFRRHSNSQC